MLTIKDLSASKELDRAAMTTVRGGFVVGDVLNSGNLFDIYNSYHLDQHVDIDRTNQINFGVISNVAGEGSVSIPSLAQSNFKA